MVARADTCLILRRFAFGETSLVLQVLTRERGRVHLIAKGAYRATSRYFAALDLFDTLELAWSEQRERELQPLSAAHIRTRRARLAHDGARYRAALALLELAGAAAREQRAERVLFDLLEGALDSLLDAELPCDAVAVAFELGFLEDLGLAPALLACAACGRAASRRSAAAGARGARPRGPRSDFSAGAGGRLCGACARESRAAARRVGTLPLDVLELAARLGAVPPRDAAGLRAALQGSDAAGLERTRDFVARFVEYHLEARPRSYRRLLSAGQRNAAVPER
jgi:DNA repair protein RecO